MKRCVVSDYTGGRLLFGRPVLLLPSHVVSEGIYNKRETSHDHRDGELRVRRNANPPSIRTQNSTCP
jgi:hypothetical protein